MTPHFHAQHAHATALPLDHFTKGQTIEPTRNGLRHRQGAHDIEPGRCTRYTRPSIAQAMSTAQTKQVAATSTGMDASPLLLTGMAHATGTPTG